MPIFSAGSASVSVVPDFSGAQKAITEFFARQSDVKVTVKPDLSQPDVARTEAELNAMHGTAKVEVDKNALSSSIQTAVGEALSRSGLDRIGSVLNAAIGPTIITGIAGAFTELAAAASQAVGIVALAPALIGAIAAPAAVVALGIHGMSDAFKALSTGDAQKIATAMAELAPAAQQVVVQVHALGPAFTAMRLDVQQTLLTGVGAAVTSLAGVALPILHTGLVGIAAAMNGGLLATMTALQGQGANFTILFSNIAAAIRVSVAAAAPLIQAFLTLAAVGSQFLPQLAAGFVDVATKFNDWVQRMAASGQLVVIIQNAINVLKELGQLAGNVASVVVGVFTAALPFGNILLDLLIKVTGNLATFIHSADGQTALSGFFSGITNALGILLPALNILVQALVATVLPAIGQLAQLLAPIAATLLTQLAAGITSIGQILPPVVQVVAALVNATAPLIPVIFQIINALLPPLVALFGQLAPIIGQVAVVLGDALLQAARAIAPLIPQLSVAFTGILNALLPLLPALLQIVTTLLPPLVQLIGALLPIVTIAVQVLAGLAGTFLQIASATVLPLVVFLLNGLATVLQVLSPVLGPIVGIIVAIVAAVKLWAIAMGILDIALDANPIGLIALAITALIAVVVLIVQHFQDFKNVVTDVVNWVVAHWQILVASIPLLGPVVLAVIQVVQFFADNWRTILAGVTTAWQVCWTTVQSVATTIWGAVSGFFVSSWAALSAAWTATWSAVSSFFQNLWTGLSSWAESSWNALAAFYVAAWSALSVGWTNFWNSVFSFFQNLWNGLVSWAQSTWNALSAFYSAAWSAFSVAWTNFWNSVFSFFQNLWNTLVSWTQSTWNALSAWLQAGLNGFLAFWQQLWTNLSNFFQNLWTALVAWTQATWNTLSTWLQNGLNGFLAFWQQLWTNLSNFFRTIWTGISSTAVAIWNGITSFLVNGMNGFLAVWTDIWNRVSGTFSTIWNGIKGFAQQVWNDIKAIIATPVNFVIGTILNNGLFRAWNAVNDFLHLPFHINPLATIPGFYMGGYTGDAGLFGTSSPEDPAGIVHAKEFVFTDRQVSNAGGPDAMYALAAQLDSGYATGGLVRQQTSDPAVAFNSYVVPSDIAPRIHRFLDALSSGQAEAVQAAGGFDALGPGFFWGGFADPVTAGKAFAQSQNGKPYIWGGVGPAGYDCSGFQSAITNVLRGSNNPYSRVGSTADFPWAGFVNGLSSAYAVGATKNAGGGIGHMAATLGGVNAESGGAHNNVAFGGPAAGATAALFNIHASLPQVGGAFVAGGPGGGGGAPTSVSILGNIISGVGDVLSMLTSAITGPLSQLTGGPGGNWVSILAQLPKTLLDGMWGIVKDAVGAALGAILTTALGVGDTTGQLSGTGPVTSQVNQAAVRYGWSTGSEWADIGNIVSHESGWNPTAQNPVSTASGLFQQIDGTWRAYRPAGAAQFAHAKDAPVAFQAIAGLEYIKAAYSDPAKAWAHWQVAHSYDTGGWLPPGSTSVYNGTGGFEAVLNQAQQNAVVGAVTTPRYDASPVWHFYLGDKEITDLVDARISYQSHRDGRTIRSSM